MMRRSKVQREKSHELPDWLQEFRENLVEESSPIKPWGNPEHECQDTSSSSHELPMESRAKVEAGSGKHSINTHFPKDPHCDICLRTKITRVSCRRRAGAFAPRAEHFGDLITADHKIPIKESESRNNRRYAVVVQDLATQWLQSYPCKTKPSQETQKNLMKFLEPTRKPKGPVIPCGALVEYHPISAKDISRLHPFGPKVLPDIFPRLCIVRGENLERRHYGRRH